MVLREYEIIIMNCDCSSNVIARLKGTHKTWKIGPRCRFCGTILKRSQYDIADNTFEAEGPNEALEKYSKAKGY